MSDSVWIGLMSGTSADGIDAALVGFDPCIRVLRTHTSHYAADLRTRLLELAQSDVLLSLDELGYLDHSVARCFAEAAAPLVTWSREQGLDLRAIGSHGQTVRHRPAGPTPFTLQLGDPSLIAERCGCTVVADFRRRDVAAGGQGAPLLPALHASAFHSPDEDRAVLNLGGIANLTLLPVSGPVRGFDTGPANALLDAWCQHALGAAFDHDGALAAAGNADPGLLAACLDEPWFALPPPKSTGREQFHLDWLRARGPRLNLCTPADVQATLIELTAHTVADALLREQPSTRRVLVCGGGVRNPVLMAALQRRLPQQVLESTAAHGLDPDWVEAVGFAWLARQTLDAAAGNIPSVTGARGPRILGGIYPGPLLASRTR